MGSKVTILKIVNNTDTDIGKIKVKKCDNFDFIDDERPDYQFQGVTIEAGKTASRKLVLNSSARTTPFTMTFHFRDGSKDQFRIDQSHALRPKYRAGFVHMVRSHLMTYTRENPNILSVIVENTMEQLKKKKTEWKLKEAEEAIEEGRFEEALKKLDEALIFTKETDLIKEKKSRIYSMWGTQLLQEAWKYELEGELKKAYSTLGEVSAKYKQTSNENLIKLITTKINGTRFKRVGEKMHRIGQRLFKKANSLKKIDVYIKAEKKFEQALSSFYKSKKEFEEYTRLENDLVKGRRYGEDAIMTADENIKQMLKLLQDVAMDKTKL